MAKTQRVTKRYRLLLIFDAYRELVQRPATTKEVADWAIVSGLYPVPDGRCTAWEADRWMERLEAAKAIWKEFQATGNTLAKG
jgi:hypothetical protein